MENRKGLSDSQGEESKSCEGLQTDPPCPLENLRENHTYVNPDPHRINYLQQNTIRFRKSHSTTTILLKLETK